jgi:antitoxin component YwqK of YwqJK toxin-antitoxin module
MRILSASIITFFMCCLAVAQTPKNGYVKKTDEKTNKLVYEGEFKNDKPVGKFKYYYPNDSVRAIMNFREGGKIAYAKLFHINGKRMAEGKYINEIKDSVWLYYDEAGTLINKEAYILGKREGKSFTYLPDGKIAEERIFKKDVIEGPFKQYFDGKLVKGEGAYLNGKLDGKVTYYYPNGIAAATGYFKNGEKNGPWIYKEKDGKIKEKELYKNGVLQSKKDSEAFFSKNKVQDNAPGKDKGKGTSKANINKGAKS